MGGIFISYRRRDTEYIAGRLRTDLSHHFGAEYLIFRDKDSLTLGPFPREIDQAVRSCDAMVVVIGDTWLDIRTPSGERRIDQPDDWVRREVATALGQDKIVVPVLVEGARVPSVEELPDDLKSLAERQAVELPDSRWDYEVDQLVRKLDRALAPPVPVPVPAPSHPQVPPVPPWAKWVGLAAAGLIALVLVLNLGGRNGGAGEVTTTTRTTDATSSTSSTTVTTRPTTTTIAASTFVGPWSASKGPLTLTVERIEATQRSLDVHLLVNNKSADTLTLPASYFNLVDDEGHNYDIAPSQSGWRETVPPGIVRGVIDVQEPLQPSAKGMRAGWGTIFGTHEVDSIYVNDIRLHR